MTIIEVEPEAEVDYIALQALWRQIFTGYAPKPSTGTLLDQLMNSIDYKCLCSGIYLTDKEKRDLLTFMQTKVMRNLRRHPDRPYHLEAHELRFYHRALEVIMPDDQLPVAGSPHDLLNRYLGLPEGSSLVHSKVGDVVRECVVMIAVAPT